jgi:hypothetical protein
MPGAGHPGGGGRAQGHPAKGRRGSTAVAGIGAIEPPAAACRWEAVNLHKNQPRRIAANIAKLSELLKRPVPYGHALHYQNGGRNLAGPGPTVFRVMREGRRK